MGTMGACGSKAVDAKLLRPKEQDATSSCLEYVTAHIESSKRHWSEL